MPFRITNLIITLTFFSQISLAQINQEVNKTSLKSGVSLWFQIWKILPSNEYKNTQNGLSIFKAKFDLKNPVNLINKEGKSLILNPNDSFEFKLSAFATDSAWKNIFQSNRRFIFSQNQNNLEISWDENCKSCLSDGETILIPKEHLGINYHIGIKNKVIESKIVEKNVTFSKSCQKAGYCMACQSGVLNAVGGACIEVYTYSNYCKGSQKFIGDRINQVSRSILFFYDDSGKIHNSLKFEESTTSSINNIRAISSCNL